MTRVLIATIAMVTISNLSAWGAELSSWNSGPVRDRIVQFVENATKEGAPSYVPPSERVAVLDNDGTLWDETPLPVELNFTIDQVRRMAPQHPEWKSKQPFKAVLEGDREYFTRLPEKEKIHQGLMLFAETHSGLSVQTFESKVTQWFKSAQDARSHASYTQRAYVPMLELLAFLRDKGFKTYIVTGGDTDFVRTISQETYGIPPEQVIGSDFQTRWENRNGKFALIRTPKLTTPVNLETGKPINIERVIGKVPVIAVGNSDGDLEMLQYAGSNTKPSLEILIRHDDRTREAAYDKGAEKVLAEAQKRNWVIVSMKNEFARIFAEQNKAGQS